MSDICVKVVRYAKHGQTRTKLMLFVDHGEHLAAMHMIHHSASILISSHSTSLAIQMLFCKNYVSAATGFFRILATLLCKVNCIDQSIYGVQKGI